MGINTPALFNSAAYREYRCTITYTRTSGQPPTMIGGKDVATPTTPMSVQGGSVLIMPVQSRTVSMTHTKGQAVLTPAGLAVLADALMISGLGTQFEAGDRITDTTHGDKVYEVIETKRWGDHYQSTLRDA